MDQMAAEAGTDGAAGATDWLLAHSARILPVPGTNSLTRISQISDALRVPMDRIRWYRPCEAAFGREVA
ncbi:MAG: hypothetical protein ACOH2H_11175 [Cypionkella sp.]